MTQNTNEENKTTTKTIHFSHDNYIDKLRQNREKINTISQEKTYEIRCPFARFKYAATTLVTDFPPAIRSRVSGHRPSPYIVVPLKTDIFHGVRQHL